LAVEQAAVDTQLQFVPEGPHEASTPITSPSPSNSQVLAICRLLSISGRLS